MADSATFHWADYLVFFLCLAASAGFAIISGFTSGKRDAAAMLVGGQDVNFWAVGFSVVASFFTAPYILGTPAEIYYFGMNFYITTVGYVFAGIITAHFFLKVFNRLKLVTAYQYFELRFNNNIRLASAIVFIMLMLFFAGIVIYAPSLAFNQVTGLSMDMCIIVVGSLCILFTAIGALKAVIWIDVVFGIVVTAVLLVLAIYGGIEAGGIHHVWDTSHAGGRTQVSFDPNPLIRHTFWTQAIGGAVLTVVVLVANQSTAQKFLSLPNLREGQKATYVSIVLFVLVTTLMALIGLVMYAYYEDCDPTSTGRVSAKDQLLILFMMDLLGHIYGLPGLFTAIIFCLSLSPVAAGLNAIAGLLLIEFVMPLVKKYTGKEVSRKRAKVYAKAIALVFGVLIIGVAYLGELVGTTILQIALSLYSICGGPILGMMVLGMFFPFATSWSVAIGLFVSLAATWCLMIGAMDPKLAPVPLSLNADNCTGPDAGNTTAAGVTPTDGEAEDSGYDGPEIFKLSYVYYSLFSVIVCVVVAVVISLFTACICPASGVRNLNKETVVCHCGCCLYCTANDSTYVLEPDQQSEKLEVSVISRASIQDGDSCKDDLKVADDQEEGHFNLDYFEETTSTATEQTVENVHLSKTADGDSVVNQDVRPDVLVSVRL